MQTDVVIRATVTKPDGIAYYGASFVRVTIGAKIGVMMSDLIDRNDAVEAIEFEKVYMTAYKCSSNGYVSEGNPFKQYNKGLDDAIKAINSLAPAEPERKWIPVSEALPKDTDRLLVTIVRSDGSKRVRSGHYYKGYFMLDNGDTWKETDKEVLAWMLLPEPYGGDR